MTGSPSCPFRNRPVLTLSLALNVLALVPVLLAIRADLPRLTKALGPDTPARRILACIFLAIMLASAALLVGLWSGAEAAVPMAQALLAVQVIYKLATAAAVGLRNPVVLSNLAIAALHATTLAVTA
ncbi:hypothetical protein HKCCSP123_10980 [Rhodobacterales bacterium HKCCSP123]|nr:hypothetical protein [Rhodobacterales bacterium HKCCSP123]